MAFLYTTLADLKLYGSVTTTNTNDDTMLNESISWAEGMFTSLTGSFFDQATETNVIPAEGWIDRAGLFTLIAGERGPVTAVTNVQYKIPTVQDWTTLTWDTDDIRTYNATMAPPNPRSWSVVIEPNNFPSGAYGLSGGPVASDDIWLKWTYTGGYAVIPQALLFTINRLAWWKYKLREAPLGRINSEMFGTREVIQSLPKDIAMDIRRWTRVANG